MRGSCRRLSRHPAAWLLVQERTGAGAPPPVQLQPLPGRPAASRVSADSFDSPSILTSPTSMEDMTPEQLATWTSNAAAPQGVQGPTAPAGSAARQRLVDAQARQPSLLRPTPVATSKVSGTTPLYSTGFKRGTANVKRQGLKKGTTDVKSDESSPLLNVLPGTTPPPAPGAVTAPGAASGAGPGVVLPMASPDAAPGAVPPGAAPGALPPVNLPSPPPSPIPNPMGAPIPGPIEPTGRWPGGEPRGVDYDPNAMTGVDNMGGIIDATTRMVNPYKFSEALKSFRPSTNIEDRRGENFNPNAPRSVGDIASGLRPANS